MNYPKPNDTRTLDYIHNRTLDSMKIVQTFKDRKAELIELEELYDWNEQAGSFERANVELGSELQKAIRKRISVVKEILRREKQ